MRCAADETRRMVADENRRKRMDFNQGVRGTMYDNDHGIMDFVDRDGTT